MERFYDNTVRAQRSVMNSKGLLSSRVYHPTRSTDTYNGSSGCSLNQGCRKWYVKTFDPLDHSQSEYIKQIKNYETGLSLVECAETPVIPCSEDNMYMLGTRKISRNTYVPLIPFNGKVLWRIHGYRITSSQMSSYTAVQTKFSNETTEW